MPQHFHIFTDGSVNPQTKTGVGACLITDSLTKPLVTLSTYLCTKHFADTSSTQLELLTFLWAFELATQGREMTAESEPYAQQYTFYTDSQNIVDLPKRRESLEKKHFLNNRGEPLHNHLLYQQFFALTSRVECELIKVKGHQRSSHRHGVEDIFSLVDKASRKELRELAD